MIDFLLDTDKDDIMLRHTNRSSTLKIQFNIGNPSSKLKIQFFVESVVRPKQYVSPLHIQFNISENSDSYLKAKTKSLLICKDNEDYEVQQIMMRLKTELGELIEYPDFGSELVDYRHRDKFDKANLVAIKSIVEKNIDTTLYEVKVRPNINTNQVMAWHNIHIKIINKFTGNVLKGFTI